MNVIKYIITRSLPKTGQSYVYTAGDDGTYQAGWWKNKTLASNKIRFIDNGNGTITDRATGLMWEKAPSNYSRNWYAWNQYSIDLLLAGYNDWRIPNIIELISIVNFAIYDPCVYLPFFVGLVGSNNFSSTSNCEYNDTAYTVVFIDGVVAGISKLSAFYAICVRTI